MPKKETKKEIVVGSLHTSTRHESHLAFERSRCQPKRAGDGIVLASALGETRHIFGLCFEVERSNRRGFGDYYVSSNTSDELQSWVSDSKQRRWTVR